MSYSKQGARERTQKKHGELRKKPPYENKLQNLFFKEKDVALEERLDPSSHRQEADAD